MAQGKSERLWRSASGNDPVANSDLTDKGYALREFDGKIDWMAQLNYQFMNGIDIYGKLSNTYRSPSLFESTVSNQTFSYDPDLPIHSENARLAEFGLIGKRDNLWAENDQLKFNINYFHNQTRDFLTQGVQKRIFPIRLLQILFFPTQALIHS